MKHYFILIHILGTPILQLSEERQQSHIKKVSGFIASLAKKGMLIDAQPFEPRGVSIAGNATSIKERELLAGAGDIVGFYYIAANSLEEVVETFKSDPRFEDTEWKMNIWPILKLEGIN
jgi:hypothetical protein